jgi:hypothetical protein
VNQDYWFAGAVILVVKINIPGVLFSNSYNWQNESALVVRA